MYVYLVYIPNLYVYNTLQWNGATAYIYSNIYLTCIDRPTSKRKNDINRANPTGRRGKRSFLLLYLLSLAIVCLKKIVDVSHGRRRLSAAHHRRAVARVASIKCIIKKNEPHQKTKYTPRVTSETNRSIISNFTERLASRGRRGIFDKCGPGIKYKIFNGTDGDDDTPPPKLATKLHNIYYIHNHYNIIYTDDARFPTPLRYVRI